MSQKRRPHDFKRRILKTNISTKKETLEEEHKWLQMIPSDQLGKRYYNLTTNPLSLNIYKKYNYVGEWNKGREPWSKGKKLTGEKYCRPLKPHVKANLRQINSRPCSEEKKAKIPASLRGKKHTEERRAKAPAGNRKPKPAVSAALKGRVMAAEHKEAIRQGVKRSWENRR